MYLYTDTGSKFNEHNCRRCPIVGHSEISCAAGRTKNAVWKIHSGFFFPGNKERKRNYSDENENNESEEEEYDRHSDDL